MYPIGTRPITPLFVRSHRGYPGLIVTIALKILAKHSLFLPQRPGTPTLDRGELSWDLLKIKSFISKGCSPETVATAILVARSNGNLCTPQFQQIFSKYPERLFFLLTREELSYLIEQTEEIAVLTSILDGFFLERYLSTMVAKFRLSNPRLNESDRSYLVGRALNRLTQKQEVLEESQTAFLGLRDILLPGSRQILLDRVSSDPEVRRRCVEECLAYCHAYKRTLERVNIPLDLGRFDPSFRTMNFDEILECTS